MPVFVIFSDCEMAHSMPLPTLPESVRVIMRHGR